MANSLLFRFAKLLHVKPKHASGEAASRDKRGRRPEKKNLETVFSRLVPHNVVVYNRAG